MTRIAVCFVLVLVPFTAASASSFTPLEWQQVVTHSANPAFEGQRKHTTWIRDQNRNFIDDEIEKHFGPGHAVDVIVDFNTCLTVPGVRSVVAEYGGLSAVGRLVTFALVKKVRFENLARLAARPEVAMIEWQEPLRPLTDVSTRAIQARKSSVYSPNTAEDRAPPPPGVSFGATQVAIIDSGVDDGVHEALPAARFLAGFNAIRYEDTNRNGVDDSCEPAPLGNGVCTDADDEPADGTTNPDDDTGHGTSVAHILLGQGTTGRSCRVPGAPQATDCGGVAPGAQLVDIKFCNAAGCDYADAVEAVDWLGTNAGKFSIRVANMSSTGCSADDGTSALAQQVNYVSALGVVMVVGHGNSTACTGLSPGDVHTGTPGSASFAITVSGTNDMGTITRNDDVKYTNHLNGPRLDFTVASPVLLAMKPDISAPAQGIFTADYNTAASYSMGSGTSLATPHVAGAAAIIRWVRQMTPDSVKDVLRRNADTQNNVAAFAGVDPTWDKALGAGMLNAYAALAAATTDVGFPSCVSAPAAPGQPCGLAPPTPPWLNTTDIQTVAPPKVGVANTITVSVKNHGPAAATVLVNFGVYVFAAGNNQFFHIGSKQVAIASGATVPVSHAWTPAATNHQCVQVSIAFGLDLKYENNVTQRNLQIAPSLYHVRIENPLMEAARMDIEAKSDRSSWKCTVSDPSFPLDPFLDCPRDVEVSFNAPAGTRPGQVGTCHVYVYASARAAERRLVGGVTVQTFVPKECRLTGRVVDERGLPARNLALTWRRVAEREGAPMPAIKAATDDEGVFVARMSADVPYAVAPARMRAGAKPLVLTPACDRSVLELVLAEGELKLRER